MRNLRGGRYQPFAVTRERRLSGNLIPNPINFRSGQMVTDAKAKVFYLSTRGFGWNRYWLFLIPAALVIVFAWPHYELAAVMAAVLMVWPAALFLLIPLLCTIRADQEGLVIYGINRLPWSNVASVAPYSLFGLRYLRIVRVKGMASWALPLYFRDEAGFYSTVISLAPPPNPLRIYAQSVHEEKEPR
jgi:hypothetical protein